MNSLSFKFSRKTGKPTITSKGVRNFTAAELMRQHTPKPRIVYTPGINPGTTPPTVYTPGINPGRETIACKCAPTSKDDTMKGLPLGNLGLDPTRPIIIQSGNSAPRVTTLDKFLTIGNNIGSQLIAAFGRQPTQQVGYGNFSIVPNTTAQYNAQAAQYNAQAQQNAAQQYYAQQAAYGSTPGGAVGSGLDGIVNWATQNPLIVLGAVGALILLYKQPPGRR